MSILSKIQALISAANVKTGESDETLTDAVQTLVDGYGQGGGLELIADVTVSEPVNVIQIDIPEGKRNFDIYKIEQELIGEKADRTFLCARLNSLSGGPPYFQPYQQGTLFAMRNAMLSSGTAYYLVASYGFNVHVTSSEVAYFAAVNYYSDNTWLAGSRIKIYGGNV